jgi:hypothetical protein
MGGYAKAQVANKRPLTIEARVLSEVSACAISVDGFSLGQVFFVSTRVFACQ